MSRKKCRRRVYPLLNPIKHAIEGACITSTARLDKLRLCELAALDAFARGIAEPNDWRILADCLNVSETMALNGIGPEALEANLAAQQALKDVHDTGTLAFTPEQLQAVRHGYEFADLQRSSIARSEFERQIKKTGDRIKGLVSTGKFQVLTTPKETA